MAPPVSGTIRHRKVTALPDNPNFDVSSSEWNDSLVLAGGASNAILVRDSGQTDGWGWATSINLSDVTVSGAINAASVTTTGAITAGGTVNANAGLVTTGITASGVVSASGGVTGSPVTTDSLALSAAGSITWAGRTQCNAPASGQLTLLNNLGTDFSRIMLGGTTNAYPAIKRTGAGIDLRLADDSGSAALGVGAITTAGPLLFSPDNTYDLGASAATRPRTGYFGTSVSIGSSPAGAGTVRLDTTGEIRWGTASLLSGSASGCTFGAPAFLLFQIAGAGGTYVETSKFYPITDNSFDLGSTGNRFRNVYTGTSVGIGTTPATTGAIRLANNLGMYARNAANTADLSFVFINSSDQVTFGNTSGPTVLSGTTMSITATNTMALSTGASGQILLQSNGVTVWAMNVTGSKPFFPNGDNVYDLGISAGARIRTGYFGTSVVNTGYDEFAEMTAPAAPSTDRVRVYAEDNGSGKTRLMALFNTGAAQQIAIQP